jgi:hypothetical protein
MLSREERILSELLLSRGLVTRDRLEACARRREASTGTASLADFLVDGGDLAALDAHKAVEEARALEASLEPICSGRAGSANSASCARSAAAGWASSTKRNRSLSGGASRSRCCPRARRSTSGSRSGS